MHNVAITCSNVQRSCIVWKIIFRAANVSKFEVILALNSKNGGVSEDDILPKVSVDNDCFPSRTNVREQRLCYENIHSIY